MPKTPRSRRPWSLLTIVVGCAVLALAILACGEAANSGSLTTGGNSASTSAQHFKVGDQVKVGDTYIVTVNSVKTSSGSSYFKPKSGDTFVVVDVTVKNVSKDEQTISSVLNFGFKDATGQDYDEAISNIGKPPDGKVEPGSLLRGQLTYEVPKTQKAFAFSFEGDIISGGQTIWDLSV